MSKTLDALLLAIALLCPTLAFAGYPNPFEELLAPPDCNANPSPREFPFPSTVALTPSEAPELRMIAECVSPHSFGSQNLRLFAAALSKQMFASFGIGLAAPQVGISQRVFVAKTNPENPFDRTYEVFLNPRLVPTSERVVSGKEGCLSLPNDFTVSRWESVQIEYFNLDGERKTAKLDGLSAILMQHETDHLNGILISDHE